ncbi:MAG: hypothetical protein AAGM22_16190 [Acidobacteriota bacterium]
MPDSPPRLWVANLDAEEAWRPGPRRALKRRVLDRIAAFGALLSTRTGPGDALWLPAPVDRGRLPLLDPGAELLTAPPAEVLRRHRDFEVRPWAEAPPWVAGRRADAAARANDRRFALELARKLGVDDPRASVIKDPADLRRWLDRWPELKSWVLKAPFSASGRDRVVHAPPDPLDDPAPSPPNRSIDTLFHRHGELLVEPWHDRRLDLGVLFHTDAPDRPTIHRQRIGPGGAVEAIELTPEPVTPDPSPVFDIVEPVARALRESGYSGPAGIDAWLHVDGGDSRWHALGEINARLSIGWLARGAADRAFGDRRHVVLRVGDRAAFQNADGKSQQSLPLVLPTPSSPGLWLEAPAGPRS